MRKLWYLPLEPYRERYTEQLLDWTERRLRRRGVAYEVVLGDRLAGHESIKTGPVLDAHGRAHWALTQMARMVSRLGEATGDDVIFVEDLFTPGYEALPYIFDQTRDSPLIVTRNYAQSVDPDDFTFRMLPWMRPFEHLVDRTAGAVFVASTVHKEMLEAAGLGWHANADIEVVGLPFDLGAVRELGPDSARPWGVREMRVVYSSRLDKEKQPHFFMDIAERMAGHCEFVFCTGASDLRSNDPSAVTRLLALERRGVVQVATGLTKRSYYAQVAASRVHLNTARQDFISFTAIEASAFGTPTLAPAFRSFPEALENRYRQLYAPWVVEDACLKLDALLLSGEPACERLAAQSDRTLDLMIDIMEAA